jgi:hypothetical protein
MTSVLDTMFVAPGTHLQKTYTHAVLQEDPNRQTPALVSVSIIVGAPTVHSSYNKTTCTALLSITQDQLNDLCDKLNAGQVEADVTYTDGTSPCPVTAWDFVPAPPPAMSVSPLHALAERVETGVSAELANDIRSIKADVSEIKARLQKLTV